MSFSEIPPIQPTSHHLQPDRDPQYYNRLTLLEPGLPEDPPGFYILPVGATVGVLTRSLTQQAMSTLNRRAIPAFPIVMYDLGITELLASTRVRRPATVSAQIPGTGLVSVRSVVGEAELDVRLGNVPSSQSDDDIAVRADATNFMLQHVDSGALLNGLGLKEFPKEMLQIIEVLLVTRMGKI